MGRVTPLGRNINYCAPAQLLILPGDVSLQLSASEHYIQLMIYRSGRLRSS